MFNVGTGVETSVNALAATIARVTRRPLPVEHIDRRDVDNIRRRVVNIEKIRRVLHWTPQVTLESGIERTVEWFVGAGPAADAEAAGRAGG